MSLIKSEDVIGYRIDSRILCSACFYKLDPTPQITEDCAILETERDEESLYFCDDCKDEF